MNFFKYILFSLTISLFSGLYAQNIIYVSTSGSNSANGSSQGQALATLSAAITQANNGDTIKFLAGEYNINTATSLDQGLLDSIVIMGAGKNQTIFNGDSVNWLNIVNNDNGVSNSYHFKGFTVKNMMKFNVQSGTSSSTKGAGIHTDYANNILFENIHFENCSSATNSNGNGGAVYFYGGYGLHVSKCSFESNWAHSEGAAIGMLYPTAKITNSVFYGNKTSDNSVGSSGTIYYSTEADSLEINHCTFARNKTASVVLIAYGPALVTNSVFNNYSAQYDIYDGGGSAELQNSVYGTEYNISPSYITGSIIDYPKFADSANYDFRIIASSPAVDKGSVSSVMEDIDGFMRNIPDAGAYESHCYTPITSLTINQGKSLTCYGSSNADLYVSNVNGGEGNITYSWDTVSNGNALGSENFIDSLWADKYFVTARDVFNCSLEDSKVIGSLLPMGITFNKTDLACPSNSYGNITVTASSSQIGYEGDYKYDWSKTAPNWSEYASFSNQSNTYFLDSLTTGKYYLTIVDDSLCTHNDSITINSPNPGVFDYIAAHEPKCFGSKDGSIDFVFSGLTAPYSAILSSIIGGGDTTHAVSNIAEGDTVSIPEILSTGNYQLILTDASGCISSSSSINIYDPQQLKFGSVEIAKNISCFGQNMGKIRADIDIDESDIYNFYWLKDDDGSSDDTLKTRDMYSYSFDTLENLIAGTYYLHVRSPNNCFIDTSITIIEPNELVFNMNTINNIQCYGDSNVSIELYGTGGTAPYNYSWDTTLTFSQPIKTVSNSSYIDTLHNVGADEYYVLVTDANFCSKNLNYIIGQPNELLISHFDTLKNIACRDDIDGKVEVNVSGGTGNYTYQWSALGHTNSELRSITKTDSRDTLVVNADSTYFRITDQNGCYKTAEFKLENPAPFSVNIGMNDTSICSGSSLSFNANLTGNYTFNWLNENDTLSQTSVYSGSPSDTMNLKLEVINDRSCKKIDSVLVNVDAQPIANAGADFDACRNRFDIPLNGTINNNIGGTWQTTGDGHFAPIHSLNADYVFGFNDKIASSLVLILNSNTNGSCLSTKDSVTVNLINFPSANAGSDVSICFGDSIQLNATATGLFPFSYSWKGITEENGNGQNIDFGGPTSNVLLGGNSFYLSDVGINNPFASPPITNDYRLTVTDVNGCEDRDTITVYLLTANDSNEVSSSICEGDIFVAGDTNITSAGTFIRNLNGINGCDSVVTYHVSIKPVLDTSVYGVFCQGQSYLAGDTTITEAGAYVRYFTSTQHGCDSVVTYNVTEISTIDSVISKTFCEGGSYSASDTAFSSTGTYVRSYTSELTGCDSVVTYNITVNNELSTIINETFCDGGSYSASDTTFSSTGSYVRTYASALTGCDSIVTYNITVNPLPEFSLVDSIKLCPGEAKEILLGLPDYLINWTAENDPGYSNGNDHVSFTQADIYYLSVTDHVYGCNKLDTLVVDTTNAIELVFTADKSVFCEGELVSLNASGASQYFLYQRADGSTYSLVHQEDANEMILNDWDFDHDGNLHYLKVIASDGICSDSAEIELTRAALPNLSLEWSKDKLCGEDTAIVELSADITDQISMDGVPIDGSTVYISEGGNYIFEATNTYGCKTNQNFELIKHPDNTPDLQNDAVANTICKDSAVTFFVDAQDYYTLYKFYINDSAGLVQSGVSNSYTASNLNHNDMIAVTVDDTNGCRFMDFQTINVDQCIGTCPIIVANYNYTIDGYSISLMDSSQGPKTNMSYTLEGVTIGTNDTISFTTNGPGFYEICLSVFDSVSNCGAEYCSVIEVSDTSDNDSISICNASFNYSISEDTLFVEQNAQGAYSEFMWSFAAQATSSDSNTHHIFESSGYYEVCLAIYDSISGCQSQTCEMIEITHSAAVEDTIRCLADFSYFMSVEGLKVNFTNNSQGHTTSFYWDFGNGSHSAVLNPEVIFEQEGYYTVQLTSYDSITGCQSSYQRVIELVDSQTLEACMADFDYYLDLENKIIYIENKSKGTYSNININFGDGNYSNDTLVHQYASSGIYDVTLTIFDMATACQTSITKSVEVIDSSTQQIVCLADFNFFPDYENDKLILSNASIGNITKYYWSLSNGAASFEENVEFDIATEGYIEVCLTVMNTVSGCQSEICKQVEYIDSTTSEVYCNANFEYFADLATGIVYFENQSEGNISNYYWEFGDGNYSRDTSVNHQYAEQGIYTVTLTTYDVVSECHSIYETLVEVISDSTVACEASFTFMPDLDEQWVGFENQSLGDFDNYFWSFGDGTFSEQESPEHIYDEYGYYEVCLTVYDEFTQCQANYCTTIDLVDESAVACLADFEVYYDLDTKTVEFFNKSEGNFDRYHWNFGDGKFSDERDPSNVYDEFGYYGVSLTVYHRASQCQSFVTIPIELLDTTVVTCYANFSYFPQGDSMIFNNESEGTVGETFWVFGDGSISMEENPIHVYEEGGIYDVSLNIFDPNTGCHSMFETSVEVIDTNTSYCNSFFTFYPHETGDVIFTAEATGSFSEVFWNFGDNTFSKEISVTKTYDEKGYYHVSLTVIDTANGCIHSYREEIVAGKDINEEQSCQADFTYYSIGAQLIQFENTSKGQYEVAFWELGDGANVESSTTFPHGYAEEGYYDVTLTVVDTAVGCFNSTTKTIVLLDTVGAEEAICDASFSYFPETNNVVKFSDESLGDVTNRYWDFGDDSAPSFGKNPSHPYRTSGYYEVCYTVFNSVGCQETHCEIVAVGDASNSCFADFAYYVDVLDAFAKFNNNALGESLAYEWDFGDENMSVAQHPAHTYEDTGYYAVCLTISNDSGCISTKCKDVSVGNVLSDRCLFTCVWPGDANNDLEANHYDLLQIGLNYGRQGPRRDSISNNWIGHGSTEWSTFQADSTNNRHADCNGDGIVTSKDLDAIDQNFAYSHFRQYKTSAEGAELSLVVEGDIIPGESVSIDVIAGDDITPLQMYGIGFELGFDEAQVDITNAVVSWNDSWLDDESEESVIDEWGGDEDEESDDFWADDWIDDEELGGNEEELWADDWIDDEEDTEFMSYDRPDLENALLMISGTRLDKRNVTGNGTLCTIEFMINPDFEGDSLEIGLFSNGGVAATGDEIDLENDQIIVAVEKVNSVFEVKNLNVFPNPSTGSIQFHLSMNDVHHIQVMDLSGRVVYDQENVQGGLVQIDLSDLTFGLYTIITKSEHAWSREKIEILD